VERAALSDVRGPGRSIAYRRTAALRSVTYNQACRSIIRELGFRIHIRGPNRRGYTAGPLLPSNSPGGRLRDVARGDVKPSLVENASFWRVRTNSAMNCPRARGFQASVRIVRYHAAPPEHPRGPFAAHREGSHFILLGYAALVAKSWKCWRDVVSEYFATRQSAERTASRCGEAQRVKLWQRHLSRRR